MFVRVVDRVGIKIPLTLELETHIRLLGDHRRLDQRVFDDFQRIGIEIFHPLRRFARVEAVVKPHLDRFGTRGIDPLDRTLDLDAARVGAAFGIRMIRRDDLGDVAVRVLDHLFAGDDVGVLEAHGLFRRQAVKS